MMSVFRVAEWLRRIAAAFARGVVFLVVLALIPIGFVFLVEISDGEIIPWAFWNRRRVMELPRTLREAFRLHVVDPTWEEFKQPIDLNQLTSLRLVE